MRTTKAYMEEQLNKQAFEINANRKEIYDLKERLKQIAAENDSLRQDKRWLQNIISPLAQAIYTRS